MQHHRLTRPPWCVRRSSHCSLRSGAGNMSQLLIVVHVLVAFFDVSRLLMSVLFGQLRSRSGVVWVVC